MTSAEPQSAGAALGLYDRAVVAAGSLGIRPWLVYFCGAIPFYTTLLLFWSDASAGADTLGYAPILTIFYLVLMWAKLHFARALAVQFGAVDRRKWGWDTALAALANQSFLNALKLVILSFAAVCIVPLASVTAFFRATLFHAAEGDAKPSRAARVTASKHRENWMSLLITFGLTLIVVINVASVLALIPQFARMFTGYEGTLSRSASAYILSRGFFVTALVAGWALADPLILAHYALRAFLDETRPRGGDLLIRIRKLAAAALFLVVLAPFTALAQSHHANPKEPLGKLEEATHVALRSPEYTWFFEEDKDASTSAFMKALGEILETVGKWIENIYEYFFPPPKRPGRGEAGEPAGSLPKLWTYGAIVLVVGWAAYLFWRMRRIGSSLKLPEPKPELDLHDESLHALSLGTSEWVRIAEQAAAQGDYRGGLRALYLGSVSALATAGMLSATPGKTNRDFEREIRRRHREGPVSALFSSAVNQFDQCWYGDHTADVAQFESMREHYSQIARHLGSGGVHA